MRVSKTSGEDCGSSPCLPRVEQETRGRGWGGGGGEGDLDVLLRVDGPCTPAWVAAGSTS